MPFAFLDVGGPEVLVILLIVLILFGGKRMPEIARGMGKAVRELKKATGSVENEFKRAMDEADVEKILAPYPEKTVAAIPAPEPRIAEHGEDGLPLPPGNTNPSKGPQSEKPPPPPDPPHD